MRRLGTWLAIVAIALQALWPLIAAARPSSVALVPVCTVDGVTHYLEVPTGKSPVDESASHTGHCPYCFFGERLSLPALPIALACVDGRPGCVAAAEAPPVPKARFSHQDARAPPVLSARIS